MRNTIRVLLGCCILLCASAGAAWSDISDAEALALELSQELLAPPDLTQKIDEDLAAIRAKFPLMNEIHPILPWEPGLITLKLDEASYSAYVEGTYTGFDSLDSIYGPVLELPSLLQWIGREFTANYNSLKLAKIYEDAEGVLISTASPGLPDGHDVSTEELGMYTFKYGWEDCTLGCIYNHFWLFEVDESGEVKLLDEWGDDLIGVETATWGQIKARYGLAGGG